MPSQQGIHTVTQGLHPDSSGTQTSLVTGGLQPLLYFSPAHPNALENTNLGGGVNVLNKNVNAQVGVLNTPGRGTDVVTNVGIPIGRAGVISISDALHLPSSTIFNPYGSLVSNQPNTTYTGTDLRIIVDLVQTPTVSNLGVPTKQLIECSTFTISIHREKAPVRATGYIGPKSFARGRRTIAGTMVLTQFTIDALYNFLMSQQMSGHDLSKDTQYVKVDQLPPFNMTLLFADEFGDVSYRRVLGVDFVTDGVVYSTNDMISEQTVSYLASDFTPLLTINDSALFTPDKLSKIFAPEKTVQTYLSDLNQKGPNPKTNTLSVNLKGLGLPFQIGF